MTDQPTNIHIDTLVRVLNGWRETLQEHKDWTISDERVHDAIARLIESSPAGEKRGGVPKGHIIVEGVDFTKGGKWTWVPDESSLVPSPSSSIEGYPESVKRALAPSPSATPMFATGDAPPLPEVEAAMKRLADLVQHRGDCIDAKAVATIRAALGVK